MLSQSDVIRVGMIRLDTHGAYYGALMDKHDPLKLRGPLRQVNGDAYSWQTGGAYYYFYTRYDDATRITVPTVDSFRITRIWDEHPEAAEDFAQVFGNRPKICGTFDEVSDDVDLVFIPDCNGDGSDHLALARPGIEKGVPTFVDKPFAFDANDARELVEMATKRGVPVTSLSILRELPDAARFRNRFEELDGVKFGTVRGGSANMAGLIHTVCLAIHIFGEGVDSVEAMGESPQVFVQFNYGGKSGRPPQGVILNCDSGPTYHCSFYASAYGERGVVHSPNMGDFEFPWGAARILEKVRDMVLTGKPPVAYNDLIEPIAITTAIRKSLEGRKRVYLSEI